MFVEDINYFSDDTAQVSIIASAVPEEFPLSSDDLEGMKDGITLLPGSTIYVVGTAAVYMLGTQDDWVEQ